MPKRRIHKEWRFFVLLENRRLRWDRIGLILIAAALWAGIIAGVRMLLL